MSGNSCSRIFPNGNTLNSCSQTGFFFVFPVPVIWFFPVPIQNLRCQSRQCFYAYFHCKNTQFVKKAKLIKKNQAFKALSNIPFPPRLTRKKFGFFCSVPNARNFSFCFFLSRPKMQKGVPAHAWKIHLCVAYGPNTTTIKYQRLST